MARRMKMLRRFFAVLAIALAVPGTALGEDAWKVFVHRDGWSLKHLASWKPYVMSYGADDPSPEEASNVSFQDPKTADIFQISLVQKESFITRRGKGLLYSSGSTLFECHGKMWQIEMRGSPAASPVQEIMLNSLTCR